MANFEDILRSANFNQNLYMNLGLSSQISEMFKPQKNITNILSGMNMMSEITKSLKLQAQFSQSAFSSIDAITKAMDWKSKFAIPTATIATISSINRQHEQLFGNLRNITDALSASQSLFSQMNNWQFALSGISGQLASIAVSQKKWDLLDDFEEITDEAIAINEKIYDSDGITTESLNEIKSFLQRIEIRVDNIDKDAKSIFWKLIALLSFLLAVSGEARNWQTKPEYATRLEVETVIKEQFSLFERKLIENKEYRTTNRECKVRLKPIIKSMIIETLPGDFEIIVLQVHHKWIYASYSSPKDNLPQTGWILKKYLVKP